jgi:Protein of unknown function (DUF3179)
VWRRGLAAVVFCLAPSGAIGALEKTTAPDIELFFEAAGADEKKAAEALRTIAASWKDGYAALFVDVARFMRSPSGAAESEPVGDRGLVYPDDEPGTPGRGRFPEAGGRSAVGASRSGRARARLVQFLQKQTGQRFADDLRRWRRWIWSRPYDPHPGYAAFKAVVYGQVDPRMASFFSPGVKTLVRLDEVDWGGVRVNGIPPLDHPKSVPARDATFLNDGNVVFGVALGGEARAYPKRILAWHELARDRLGGVELAIVYCTLCGTVIPYDATVGGRMRTFGTSGLLYRSNKLMFDEETLSLWSSVEGRPVIGPLAGTALSLTAYSVVTTTWREWVKAHPDTTVLALDTGYDRDYGEGVAYRDYFASDALMFEVPRTDERLRNKDEVLALLLRPAGSPVGAERRALAISARFLARNRLHSLSFAGHDLVVVTSPENANRVYHSGGVRFTGPLPDGRLEDAAGRRWQVTEDALRLEGGAASPLPRVPARRAFWFGWQAQYPETELVK